MKFLLSMSLIVSVFVYADDHNDEKPMYEANVAEYYFSTFKDGKDMDDMMRWAEKWEKWATTGDAADANADYRASMLIPYYGEISIIIAVACKHRDQAYVLSRYIIEEIKKRSPIWKKEHYENEESEWLKGNPITNEKV